MSKPNSSGPPSKPDATKPSSNSGQDRRGFVAIAAGAIGAIVAAVPLLAGLRMFVDPLTRTPKKKGKDDAAADDGKIRVATLAAMPEIGKVYRFPVITTREDKWSKYEPGPVGAVFLRRVSADPNVDPVAFTSVCPHLGCSVDIKGEQFKCPCHNSTWTIEGERINPESCPSPRGLDTLKVEVKGNDVFVAYKRFRGGIEDKVEE
ncbi:MAG: Rieske (2Fe-2S) protein [Pirellulales bacterium]